MPNLAVHVLNGSSNIGSEGVEVDPGQVVNVYIACDPGFYFDYASDELGNIIKSNPIKLRVVDHMTLRAVCSRPSTFLNVYVDRKGAGRVTVTHLTSGEGVVVEVRDTSRLTVDCFSTVELRAYPNEGFEFKAWLVNGKRVSHDQFFSFEMPLNEVELVAVFEYEEFDVQVIFDRNFGVVSGAGRYPRGATVRLQATAQTGARFVGWYRNNQLLSASETYEFIVNGDTVVQAVFEPLVSQLTLRGNWQKFVQLSVPETLNYGQALTIHAPVIEHYKPVWKVNGRPYADNAQQITIFGTGQAITVDLDYVPREVPLRTHVYPYDCAKVFVTGDRVYKNTVIVQGFASGGSRIKKVAVVTREAYEAHVVGDFEFIIPVVLDDDNELHVVCEAPEDARKPVNILYRTRLYQQRVVELPVVESYTPERVSVGQYYDYLNDSDIFNLPTGERSPFISYEGLDKLGWPQMFRGCRFAVLTPGEPVLDVLSVSTNRTLRYGQEYITYTFEPDRSFSGQNSVVVVLRPSLILDKLTVSYLTIANGAELVSYIEAMRPLGANVLFRMPDIVWVYGHGLSDLQVIAELNRHLLTRRMDYLQSALVRDLLPDILSTFLVEVTPVYGHRIVPAFEGFPLRGRLLQLAPYHSELLGF